MKVTLRKAAQILGEVSKKMVELASTPTAIDVKPLSKNDVIKIREEARKKFCQANVEAMFLAEVTANIRLSVGNANHTFGVNNLLTSIAHYDAEIKRMSALKTSLVVSDSNDVLEEEFQRKIKEMTEPKDSYYGSTTLRVNVCNQDDLNALNGQLVSFKREKSLLTDRLLQVNTNNEIEIADDIWTDLIRLGIV